MSAATAMQALIEQFKRRRSELSKETDTLGIQRQNTSDFEQQSLANAIETSASAASPIVLDDEDEDVAAVVDMSATTTTRDEEEEEVSETLPKKSKKRLQPVFLGPSEQSLVKNSALTKSTDKKIEKKKKKATLVIESEEEEDDQDEEQAEDDDDVLLLTELGVAAEEEEEEEREEEEDEEEDDDQEDDDDEIDDEEIERAEQEALENRQQKMYAFSHLFNTYLPFSSDSIPDFVEDSETGERKKVTLVDKRRIHGKMLIDLGLAQQFFGPLAMGMMISAYPRGKSGVFKGYLEMFLENFDGIHARDVIKENTDIEIAATTVSMMRKRGIEIDPQLAEIAAKEPVPTSVKIMSRTPESVVFHLPELFRQLPALPDEIYDQGVEYVQRISRGIKSQDFNEDFELRQYLEKKGLFTKYDFPGTVVARVSALATFLNIYLQSLTNERFGVYGRVRVPKITREDLDREDFDVNASRNADGTFEEDLNAEQLSSFEEYEIYSGEVQVKWYAVDLDRHDQEGEEYENSPDYLKFDLNQYEFPLAIALEKQLGIQQQQQQEDEDEPLTTLARDYKYPDPTLYSGNERTKRRNKRLEQRSKKENASENDEPLEQLIRALKDTDPLVGIDFDRITNRVYEVTRSTLDKRGSVPVYVAVHRTWNGDEEFLKNEKAYSMVVQDRNTAYLALEFKTTSSSSNSTSESEDDDSGSDDDSSTTLSLPVAQWTPTGVSFLVPREYSLIPSSTYKPRAKKSKSGLSSSSSSSNLASGSSTTSLSSSSLVSARLRMIGANGSVQGSPRDLSRQESIRQVIASASNQGISKELFKSIELGLKQLVSKIHESYTLDTDTEPNNLRKQTKLVKLTAKVNGVYGINDYVFSPNGAYADPEEEELGYTPVPRLRLQEIVDVAYILKKNHKKKTPYSDAVLSHVEGTHILRYPLEAQERVEAAGSDEEKLQEIVQEFYNQGSTAFVVDVKRDPNNGQQTGTIEIAYQRATHRSLLPAVIRIIMGKTKGLRHVSFANFPTEFEATPSGWRELSDFVRFALAFIRTLSPKAVLLYDPQQSVEPVPQGALAAAAGDTLLAQNSSQGTMRISWTINGLDVTRYRFSLKTFKAFETKQSLVYPGVKIVPITTTAAATTTGGAGSKRKRENTSPQRKRYKVTQVDVDLSSPSRIAAQLARMSMSRKSVPLRISQILLPQYGNESADRSGGSSSKTLNLCVCAACHKYAPENQAEVGLDGKMRGFCNQECLDRYLQERNLL